MKEKREDYSFQKENGILNYCCITEPPKICKTTDVLAKINKLYTTNSKKNCYRVDRNGKINYYFKFNDSEKIIIRVSCDTSLAKSKQNELKEFEKIIATHEKEKSRKRKGIVLGIVISSISSATLSYIVQKVGPSVILKATTNSAINDLEEELKIHTGYALSEDGKVVIPSLSHGSTNMGCDLGDPDTLSVEERIIKFCDDYDLGDEVKEAALNKYDLLYNNNLTEAMKINLKEIFNNNKSKGRKK